MPVVCRVLCHLYPNKGCEQFNEQFNGTFQKSILTQDIGNVPEAEEWVTEVSRTHMPAMCVCAEKPRGPSDSNKCFFKLMILTASFYWCSEGFPCRFHCVYTAAVLYGLVLICSIKHIVYKRVCLLGVFHGNNFPVKKGTFSTVAC